MLRKCRVQPSPDPESAADGPAMDHGWTTHVEFGRPTRTEFRVFWVGHSAARGPGSAVGPTMAWPIQIYVAKKTSMFPQRPFRYSSSSSRPKDGEPPTSVGRLHRSRTELYSSTHPYRTRSQLCPWRRGRSRASHRHPMEHGTRNPSKHWILEWSRLRECSPFPHHRQRP